MRTDCKIEVFPKRTLVLLTGLTCLLLAAVDPCWAIKVVSYNLLNYGTGREAYFKTILNAIQPDVLVAQEVSNQAGADHFRDYVLNAADGPGGYTEATFHNGGDTSNALFYRAASITYGGDADHIYLSTSPRHTDRWKLGLAGGSVYFYVYSMHLKAGTTAGDLASRLTQCTTVRNDANALPTGTHFVYVGDFNIQSSYEDSYQQLVGSQADNDGRGFDPIDTPGTWHAVSSFSCVHTQCPHNNNANPPPGSVGGGMDDRFDFILVSSALIDGQGFDYVSGTYKAYGNDCAHFNNDINDPPVIPEGQAIADALHSASDHLPVVLDLTAPPSLVAPASLQFGVLIVGASSPDNERILTVQNGAVPPALNLQYQFTSVPPGYSLPGGTGPFTLGPQESRQHTVVLSTAAYGSYNGNLQITHNAGGSNPKNVFLSGRVKRHAVPSTNGSSQVLTAPLSFGSHWPGGFSNQTALIYNVDYDTAYQSLLEVFSYNITGTNAARFSLPGFALTSVTDTPGSFAVHFDDSGAGVGAYTAAVQFSTRDDTTLPGWTSQSAVTFNLTATVGIKGDMNVNDSVEVGDIAGFVGVLLDPAGSSAEQRWLADMSGDGIDDGRDVQPFVAALLGTP